jgi:O-antigen/teichoic acid export membrane protein
VIFIRRDFLAVVYSSTLGQIAGDIYLLIRYRKLFQFKSFTVNKDLLKSMLAFGLPILIATSLSSFLNSLDRLSLRVWSDFHEIGIFTATLKIAAVVTIVQTSFTSFWIPTAYRWYSEKKSIKYYKIVSDSILLVMSLLAVSILVFKNFIISILSSGYSDSQYLIGLLCLQPIIFTVSETTCLGIVFSKKNYLSIWVSLIALIPNIVINVVLVPRYGAIGAAVATSVSYLFFFMARTYFSSRQGMKFSFLKHYIIFIALFAGATINTLHIKNILLFNFLLLLIIVIFQLSTIKQVWKIYKKEKC